MIYTSSPYIKQGEIRHITRFAFLPVQLDGDKKVWLDFYKEYWICMEKDTVENFKTAYLDAYFCLGRSGITPCKFGKYEIHRVSKHTTFETFIPPSS